MLSDCTDTCDLNLNSIQVVADGPTVQPTLKDLSIKDKQLICSGFFTHSILLGLLSEITGNFAESLAPTLSVNAQIYSRPTTVSEFEKFRDELMESSPSNGNFFFKML